MYMHKQRIRSGMIIGLEELRSKVAEAREMATELMMEPGYIGFIDIEDQMRVYIFDLREEMERTLAVAKELNFRTAGKIAEPIFISNGDLNRPHLKYKNKSQFYKELYR